MALTWDVTACEDSESLIGEQEWPITNALVWATISCGMCLDDPKDFPEFYARLYVVEKLTGPMIADGDGKPYSITAEDVRKRIGLRTNVGHETRAQWLKRFVGYDLKQGEAAAKKALAESGVTA